MGKKVIFFIRVGFGYGFGVSTYIPVTRPVPAFWNREKPIPKLSQTGKNPSNRRWFGRVPTDTGFVAMPSNQPQLYCKTTPIKVQIKHNKVERICRT